MQSKIKISLRFKFLICYLLLVVLTVGLLNTYGHKLMYQRLLDNAETSIYNEAEEIKSQYLANAYLVKSSITSIRKQLCAIHNATGIRIWISETDGKIIIDSDMQKNKEGYNINEYDSSLLSKQTVNSTNADNLLSDQSFCVVYPVTSGLDISFYIILSLPVNTLHSQAVQNVDAILICYIIISALLFIALLFLYLQTVIPLKSMQQAAKEYAAGHYDYQMPEYAGHDHTDLAGAIQYLATKMKDTNEYQKNFIANVSHDFRSPLTSIKGYTQAMADGTIPPEMQGKYLDIILFEVERLTKLTNNLLSLSEFENKGVPLEISTFDINKELKRCLATFEQRCTQKHISLDITFDAKTSLVDADQSKIEQVIQNLVDNAIKFSNDDSTIEIHTREKNQKVFVSVKDHGIGIPKESLGKVWKRFYKTDLSRSKDKKGTGLGLPITKEIIENHGENINVISTEGVGTEFIFSLPKHTE